MLRFYPKKTNLYFEQDSVLNNILNNPKNKIRCKFHKIDMSSFSRWKHEYSNNLYIEQPHWKNKKQIYK